MAMPEENPNKKQTKKCCYFENFKRKILLYWEPESTLARQAFLNYNFYQKSKIIILNSIFTMSIVFSSKTSFWFNKTTLSKGINASLAVLFFRSKAPLKYQKVNKEKVVKSTLVVFTQNTTLKNTNEGVNSKTILNLIISISSYNIIFQTKICLKS